MRMFERSCCAYTKYETVCLLSLLMCKMCSHRWKFHENRTTVARVIIIRSYAISNNNTNVCFFCILSSVFFCCHFYSFLFLLLSFHSSCAFTPSKQMKRNNDKTIFWLYSKYAMVQFKIELNNTRILFYDNHLKITSDHETALLNNHFKFFLFFVLVRHSESVEISWDVNQLSIKCINLKSIRFGSVKRRRRR